MAFRQNPPVRVKSYSSTLTTADPVAPMLARSGDPGSVSGRSSGADSDTSTDRVAGSMRTPYDSPG